MATETIGDLNERSRRASGLVAQLSNYRGALDVIGHDPQIAAFTVAAGDKSDMGEWPDQVTVLAEGITTPPQMLDAIKQQVEERIKQINAQLTELGVSASTAASAAKASAQPAREPEKPEPKQAPRTTPRPTSHKR